jgi:hypothetical protein
MIFRNRRYLAPWINLLFLAGLKKNEVKIEVEDGRILQISGERKKEDEKKNDKWHRIERSDGKFLRCFCLPENAKVDEVKATMENGVLTITVPKQSQSKAKVRSIEISELTDRKISGYGGWGCVWRFTLHLVILQASR